MFHLLPIKRLSFRMSLSSVMKLRRHRRGRFIREEEERNFNIYQMSYDEVKRYDVGSKIHPRFSSQERMKAVKPLLEEVIDSVEAYVHQKKSDPVWYNIETKTTPETDNLCH